MEAGKLPPDFVEIYMQGLTKSEACEYEQKMIRQFNPIFNKPMGQALLKLSQEDVAIAQRFKQSQSYKEVAEAFGVSTMCMWRALNGKNKNAPND